MFKRLIAVCLSSTLLAAGAAHADEADVRRALETLLGKGAKADSIRKSGVLGLYEVVVGGEISYIDEKGGYIIFGNIVDIKAKRDITRERAEKLAQIKFSDLPLDMAVKQVKGSGRRVIATFEDPNCGYCKKLAKELVGMNDVTVYTFLYPILSPDSIEKSQNIWCAADRVKSWNDWMVNNSAPTSAKCDNPVQKTIALGQKLKISGTPTIFFADGSRAPGYLSVAQLEQALAKVESGAKAAK